MMFERTQMKASNPRTGIEDYEFDAASPMEVADVARRLRAAFSEEGIVVSAE